MQTSGEPSVVCILIASLELLSGNDEINVVSLELISIRRISSSAIANLSKNYLPLPDNRKHCFLLQ